MLLTQHLPILFKALNILSKQLQSLAQLQCSSFAEVPQERGLESELWIQLQDTLGELFRVGCGTDAQLKDAWTFVLLLKEEGNAFANCLEFVSD